MTVNVASGVVFVPGTEVAAQGVYFCENDATVNLSIATAPGTGLNRIDLVVARVQDSFYSGGTNAWSLFVVTGTAAASPSAPTPPSNAVILAQIFVGANVTSITTGNITDTRYPYAAALGGISVARSTARPANPSQYETIIETDTGHMNQWNGAAWNWPEPHGIIAYGNRASNSSGTISEIGVLRLDNIPIVNGRMYEIVTGPLVLLSNVGNDCVAAKLHVNTAGTATTSSGTTAGQFLQKNVTGSETAFPSSECLSAIYNPGVTGSLSVLLSVARTVGTGTVSINAGFGSGLEMWVKDLGLAVSDTGVDI
jgi:hypothetical protein